MAISAALRREVKRLESDPNITVDYDKVLVAANVSADLGTAATETEISKYHLYGDE